MVSADDFKCAFFFHDTDYFSGGTRSLLDIIDFYTERSIMGVIAVFPSDSGSAIDYLKHKGIPTVTSHYYQIRAGIDESVLRKLLLFPKRIFQLLLSRIWMQIVTIPQLKKTHVNVVYSNTSFIIAGLWAGKEMGVPVVAHFREFGEEDHKISVWFGRKSFYKMALRYKKIICISEALKRKYESFLPSKKLIVIHDDVSSKYINQDALNRKITGQLNILIAGNLTPGKGQLTAIRSLTNLLKQRDVILYIAGNPSDIEYVNEIKKYISENHIAKNVKMLGLVKDMNELRKEMDVGIVLSEKEAFGRVTIEGMLSGLIMIASNEGGSPELIQDGVTGFLVEQNGAGLETCIKDIMKNTEMVESIRRNAFKYAKRYTEGHCAEAVASVLRGVTE